VRLSAALVDSLSIPPSPLTQSQAAAAAGQHCYSGTGMTVEAGWPLYLRHGAAARLGSSDGVNQR